MSMEQDISLALQRRAFEMQFEELWRSYSKMEEEVRNLRAESKQKGEAGIGTTGRKRNMLIVTLRFPVRFLSRQKSRVSSHRIMKNWNPGQAKMVLTVYG